MPPRRRTTRSSSGIPPARERRPPTDYTPTAATPWGSDFAVVPGQAVNPKTDISSERGEDGGWGAYFPDLLGGVALGARREEVASRIKEAVYAYAREQAALGPTFAGSHRGHRTIEAA